VVSIFSAGCFLSLLLVWAAISAPRPSGDSGKSALYPKQQFAAAVAAYKTGHFAEAQTMLAPLAKSNPNSFEINELLGLTYAGLGHDEKANSVLVKAVRLKPDLAEARTTLATNLLRLHRNSEAERQFKKAVEIAPKSYDVNHNMGEFYAQAGRLSDATVFLKRAQELNPKAENNGYDLALAYEQQGKLDDARGQIEALIGFNDVPELHSLLAEIEEKSKNYLASAAQYEQAARMDPSEQNVFDWGTELLLHQTFAPAAEVFKAGLARFPESVRLQLGLGIALYGDGQYDNGASAFLVAANMSPADPLPLTFLGRAYESLSPGMADQVLARLKAFVEKHANSAAVRYYYALALWKLNEKEPRPQLSKDIETLLRGTIATDPAYTQAYLQLGILYANENRYPDAISNYEKALKLDSNLPNVHYRLGQALMRSGDAPRAREEFARFERLREMQAKETDNENSEIKQFVYTMRNPVGGKPQKSESKNP
jgi:tetratricopeptide (TPR) repeat protein